MNMLHAVPALVRLAGATIRVHHAVSNSKVGINSKIADHLRRFLSRFQCGHQIYIDGLPTFSKCIAQRELLDSRCGQERAVDTKRPGREAAIK